MPPTCSPTCSRYWICSRGTVGNDERKRLKRAYKDLRPTGGVFAVTNTIDGKTFLGSCLDAERPLRRIRFELLA